MQESWPMILECLCTPIILILIGKVLDYRRRPKSRNPIVLVRKEDDYGFPPEEEKGLLATIFLKIRK